jgi:predicted enzyme related to lactoylglutathione lyase
MVEKQLRRRVETMADGFIWYELVTNDIDKAVNFYKRVIGWDIKDSGMPGMKYMLFGMDGKDVGGIMTWAGAGAPDLSAQWIGAHPHRQPRRGT